MDVEYDVNRLEDSYPSEDDYHEEANNVNDQYGCYEDQPKIMDDKETFEQSIVDQEKPKIIFQDDLTGSVTFLGDYEIAKGLGGKLKRRNKKTRK